MTSQDVEAVVSGFAVDGKFENAVPFGSGHINDTFRVTMTDGAGETKYYTLQRINHNVFRHPDWVMDNISRVLDYLKDKREACGNMQVLELIRTREGKNCLQTMMGTWWRMYHFVDGVCSYDSAHDPEIVYEAARGFAKFQDLLADLPLPRLHETIPNFHHTPMRYAMFEEAVYEDVANRVADVQPEIEFVRNRKHIYGRLLSRYLRGEIPERITHNDTKLNNALFNPDTKECTVIVDLDTIMPGVALYDFGDMIRVAANTADESEPDTEKVDFNMEMFDAAVRGYLERADFLVPAEIEELAFSARLITMTIGIRFLTDYVQGDVYFKIHYPHQNLDRARVQFKLVERMEARMDEMAGIVKKYAEKYRR